MATAHIHRRQQSGDDMEEEDTTPRLQIVFFTGFVNRGKGASWEEVKASFRMTAPTRKSKGKKLRVAFYESFYDSIFSFASFKASSFEGSP